MVGAILTFHLGLRRVHHHHLLQVVDPVVLLALVAHDPQRFLGCELRGVGRHLALLGELAVVRHEAVPDLDDVAGLRLAVLDKDLPLSLERHPQRKKNTHRAMPIRAQSFIRMLSRFRNDMRSLT